MTAHNLDYFFKPRSIAVAGVSTTGWNAGTGYVQALLEYGFQGEIYPLSPKGGEYKGLKVYTGVKELPEPVDLVISCIPAVASLQLVADCAAKGIKAVHLFASGFSESTTEEGRQLEARLRDIAKQGDVRLIGPNGMGICSPSIGLSFGTDYPLGVGKTSFFCQSGGNSVHFMRDAVRRGIGFNKVASFGNACDVNESDLLEYFAADPETEIIAIYIEGVKDGRRFCRVLGETTKAKPVIVMKGGRTEAGTRAAASHTGSLAGSDVVWDGLLQQAGAIRTYSLEELLDMVVTFQYLPSTEGRRVGLVGLGGGAAVVAADDCISAGLSLPRLPLETEKAIRDGIVKNSVTSDVGLFLSNPVDVSGHLYMGGLAHALRILDDCDSIDSIMVHLAMGVFWGVLTQDGQRTVVPAAVNEICEFARQAKKPMTVVVHSVFSKLEQELARDCQKELYEAGLPAYNSISAAAKAVDRFLRYHENRPA